MRLWKYISARALAADLTEAGYPVSEDVVQRWKRNQQVDPRAADKVAELLGMRVDAKKEPPEPVWVERLLAGVMALESDAEITGDELDAAEARAAAYLAVTRQRRPRQEGGGGASGASA